MPSTQEEFTLPLRPRDTADNTLVGRQISWMTKRTTRRNITSTLFYHPNVSGLPGLDFAVRDDVPSLNRRYSGLFRLIALPRDELSKPHSTEGIKAIASRLHAVFQAELRSSDKSRDFDISHKKIPVIMRKITGARRRFLDSDADKILIPAEFFNFLHTIDHFIFKTEFTFQTNVTKHLKKNRSRDESDD
ncbi:hypothetical protein CCUS01_09992 [Colletotrichum cuscutae]|uniref:Uncharacterized protein n=1 Tax=Colletotrichum cuscutae TaxID=1209917 RepID=A0AAI9UHE3_9PEZI|nr:hypothetical protein CCUS01_09992 [Colletotrichum cuscutae]